MIYFDNAATTKAFPEVLDVMNEGYEKYFANPSSTHHLGSQAKAVLDDARGKIADLLNCKIGEIYFTSGATESINWVLKESKEDIITSKTEHKATLQSCKKLEDERKISYLDVDPLGQIYLDELDKLSQDGGLISILYANNETGVIQDINEISRIARKNKCLLHVDAVQALGKIDLDLDKIDVDFLSLSAHKINGPKGVGLLYKKSGVPLDSYIDGGGQELSLRAGTENLPAILAFAKAMEISLENLEEKNEKIAKLRDYLEESLLKSLDGLRINGIGARRTSNISSLSFKNLDATTIIMMLDLAGICVSAGSACTAGSIENSHVISAMDKDEDYLKGTVRVSLAVNNTKDELDIFIDKLIEIIDKIS